MIEATIISDSISASSGQRLTTFELEYPRFILAEINTHRQLSRNTASSRAISISSMLAILKDHPSAPVHWGANQPGMQATAEISENDRALAYNFWMEARDAAVDIANRMNSLGLHKQVVNRILEPFQTVKTITTATSFDNFFNLRCHMDAQPEIRELANKMLGSYKLSKPEVLSPGEWHTPYIHHLRNSEGVLEYWVDGNKLSLGDALKISCSCSAQVSYRKNDTSVSKAVKIYDKLVNSKPVHASAFEHCGTPMICDANNNVPLDLSTWSEGITHVTRDGYLYSGNFNGWVQYRQLIDGHDCKRYEDM